MLISVIVPIYNVERYIRDCIVSVLNQTWTELELILVDDGSADQSGSICDEFAARDSRIKVIHKQNEGALCARKRGLEAAGGELAAFVDADDWIEDYFLERLAGCMEETDADIVISGCANENKGICLNERNLIPAGIYENEELERIVFSKMLYYQGFYQFGILPYMCNKIFRGEKLEPFLKDIDIRIYDGEDAAIVYPYLLFSRKAVIIEDCMYHYRLHGDSVSFQKGKGFYENVSRLYLHLNRMFQLSEHYEIMCPQLEQYMRRMVWLGIPEKLREKEQYFFPFGQIPQNADIVLYGAGGVGVKYFSQIKRTKYCRLVLWADRNYLNLRKQGLPVHAPEMIAKVNCDFVVIANASKQIREEIAGSLISMGIRKEKIVMGEEDAWED